MQPYDGVMRQARASSDNLIRIRAFDFSASDCRVSSTVAN